ncbi:hypothetical protein E2C01_079805 [Portunus trituberculatus]|uniref:Uncharacterized protein n=1 Tax=Portunus trituberculatus TaxID=210409 RepID=A0A5B7IUA7_PORTR|nr:hypothetical protein [Portunus trituberculatus]
MQDLSFRRTLCGMWCLMMARVPHERTP